MTQYIYGQSSKNTRITSYPSSRTCSEASCSTTLSIYNSSAYCSLHGSLAPRTRAVFKRARS